MIAFIAGLFVGACCGVMCFAVADIAKHSDEDADRLFEEYTDADKQ